MSSSNTKLFGTDGIRGIANRYPMTAEIALKTGRAAAHYFRGRGERPDRSSVILIGKDTRRSSYMIEQALAAGITSQGAFALLVGPMPSPAVAFLVKNMRADAGIMVSASHNTYEYNGIKIFGHDGFKLPDQAEEEIENLITSTQLEDSLPVGDQLGRAKRIDDAIGRYIVMAKSVFPQSLDLRGRRVVLDCAHGAAYKIAPLIFQELGAEVISLGVSPDGTNINKDSGALHPETLVETVLKYRADLGIALDGDADRVLLVDEKGELLDGDELMAILAIELKNQKRLAHNTLVTTPMSNMGLEVALKKQGISVERAGIGDRAVVDLMRKNNYNLGGEQSGHIVLLDYATTGDGAVAALAVMGVMEQQKKKLSELKRSMTLFPQVLKNVRIKERVDLETIPEIHQAIQAAHKQLGDRGRILVRYSGTEPLCRVMAEASNADEIEKISSDLCALIQKHLGV